MKLLYLVFLLLLIPVCICFGEEETSADNSAPGKKHVDRLCLKLEKQVEQMLAAVWLTAPPYVL